MANKSFKISGQLDISNIISNTEKLRNALKSSLDTASFQKIEKEFDKLAQAQAAYQQAMKGSFANQSDIKAANKAIADFQKTYAKLSSTVQATLNTKGINISGDLAKGFEEERKAIEAEKQKLAKATKEWKTQIQNALTGSSLPKSDQQALARSIFSEEEFKKQIERIKKESEKAFLDMRAEVEGQKANLTSKQGEITSYTDEQKRQTFLSASQQTEYGKLQSKKGVKETALNQQKTDLERLEKEYNDTQKAYKQRIEGLRNLESALQQERMLAANAAQEEAQYRQQHPGATIRNNAELNRLANQTKMRRATVQGAQARLNDYAKGDTVKSLEEDRKKSEQKLSALRANITNLEAEIQSLTAQTDILDQIADTNANARLSDIATQLAALEQRLNEVNTEESTQNQQLQDIEHSYDTDHPTDENTEALEQRERALNEQIDAARRAAVENSGLTETLEETSEAIRENTEESQKNVNEMDELIDSQNKVDEAFDNMKNSIKTFLSIGSAISGLRRVLQETFNDVKELDKSFANIAMVTNYSVGQMWESYGQYAEMANELGQSTKSVIEASGLFYQQGLDTAESLALTKDTMKLATLAGTDFAEATSQMTAALRGFKMEMDEGARVTDVYSELAAKAAADVQGIAYAMSKTASIAASAGMEFETTSAFLTQMIETTQEAPENIGTAMKTIIARFTELKENVAGTEDSEFDDLDYNKVDIALKSVGISLKDASGQFRDLDDVFLELSEKWDTLDRNTQRYIATIAAGSRQQSRFIAMMENYDRTVELVDTAYNSAGKSSEQFAKYQDTVEYKLNQISNSWEQLRTTIFDSDTYKKSLDIVNNLMNAINDMDLTQILTIGILGLTLGKHVITNFITGLKDGSTALSQAWTATLDKAFDTKGKSLFNFNGLKKAWKTLWEKELDPKKYVKNMNEVLGPKSIDAPKLETNIEMQKTQELQKQLEIYQQLELKRKQVLATAQQELSTGKGISQETLNQSNQAKQLTTQQLEYLNQLAKELGYEQQITTENAEQLMQKMQERGTTQNAGTRAITTVAKSAGTSAITAGLTTALMSAFSGVDFGTVIKSTLLSALAAAIPPIISALAPTIIAALTGPVGIAVAVIALIGVAIWKISSEISKVNNAAEKSEKRRLTQVKKLNEQLQKQQEQSLKNYQSKLKEIDSLEESITRYQELDKKAFLNSNEQEEYNNLAAKLNDQYPEIISAYDENTNKITFNTLAIEELTRALKEEANIEKQASRAAAAAQVGNYSEQVITTKGQLSEFNKLVQDTAGAYSEYKVAVNSNADAEALKGLIEEVNGTIINGYVVGDASMTGSGSQIYSEARSILSHLSLENALAAGITESMYNASVDGSWQELNEVLEKAQMSTADFAAAVQKAANIQIETGQAMLEEEERQRVENILLTTEGLDISEQMAEVFSYVAEDNADMLLQRSKDMVNTYFQDLSAHESVGTNAANTIDFLQDVKAWKFGTNAASGYSQQMRDAYNALGYGETANEETGQKAISSLFDSGTNAVKWGDLTQKLQETLTAMGVTAEEWDDMRKDSATITNYLKEAISYQMSAAEGFISEDISTDVLKENQYVIENLEQVILDYSLKTFDEYTSDIEQAKDRINNDELRAAVDEYYVKSQDSIAKQWENNISVLENLGITAAEELTYEVTTSLQQMIADLNLGSGKRKKIGNLINETLTGLDMDAQNILLSIDLTKSYGELLSSSEDYIKALVETGMNAVDAAELFNNYIESAAKIIGKGIFGEAGAAVFRETLNEQFKEFSGLTESLVSAQNEFIEEGTLSSETYFKLLEEGFGEYVDVTSDGYILLKDKAEEYYTEIAKQPEQMLDSQIDIQSELIKEAEDYFDELNSLQTDIIAQYNNLKDAGEDTTAALSGLNEEQADFIKMIADSGYSNIEDYIQALKEGRAELMNMRPEVQIQGLIAIKESYNDVTEQVKELNDELDDLNEQLVEDKEKVDETYKAWQEAIHGSEDYRSSLDGLLNYSRRLENFNKQLKQIKNSLGDVTSIDEAKNMLNSITGLYENKMATLLAENKVIDQSLANIDKEIIDNYSDFIYFDEFGQMNIDIAAVESADMSDILKNDGFTQLIEKRYELYDKSLENDQEYLAAQEEFDALLSEAREGQIAIEEKVIDILKEQMQEEVDAVKDKYNALEEADSNYLDALQEAIDKQRKLREQENQYEDLATKEKKLALMQRDTSGANQKDVQKLEKEIEDDRQNLLDSEIDNLIDSMKELYEKQKEARDLEIEAMEAATENMQLINETALNIISGFTNVEDYQAWLLQNDVSVQEMTATQTEAYLDEAQQTFAGYAQYVALTAEEMALKTDAINQNADSVFENTNENISNIGTTIQQAAQKASDEAIAEAKEAYDDAVEKMNETQKKITETQQALETAEASAIASHSAAMDAMVEASESGLLEVATFAAKSLIEFSGLDLSSPEAVKKFAEDNNFMNKNTGEYSQSFINALADKGYDTSTMAVDKQWQIYASENEHGYTVGYYGPAFDTKQEAENALASGEYTSHLDLNKVSLGITAISTQTGAYKRYATGGFVDYTGPAWVDGTPQKPESFLSAEDTARIGAAAKLLADLPVFNTTSNAENAVSTNIGDTSIEIHINVENISDDYDVDQMIERVKQDIVDVAKPIGTSVILNK